MPLNKNFLFELSVFIAVVAVAGHLTTHFWDRYFFHNEISNMKTSLHLLKHTVMDIGDAYDSLHKELNEIAKIQHRQNYAIHHHQEQHQRHWDRRKQHDQNVLSMLKEKSNTNHAKKTSPTTHNVSFNKDTKNATTLTRPSLKSTGVGVVTRPYCVYKNDCHCNKTHRNQYRIY